MKQIRAISKLEFDIYFNSGNIPHYEHVCFISILDINEKSSNCDITSDNFLQVRMWDIEDDLYEHGKLRYEKPSDIELQKLVNFIKKHNDTTGFIVHCSAGISRSGAVATFIYDKYQSEIDSELFTCENKYINPNKYILNRMKILDV